MIEKPKWTSGWPSSECYYNADGSRRDTNFKHKLISIKDVLDLPEFNVIENESEEQDTSFNKKAKRRRRN